MLGIGHIRIFKKINGKIGRFTPKMLDLMLPFYP
jgi:hypothetical protein